MTGNNTEIRVLAIDPTTSGFGFVVLEGRERLIDWGVKEVAGEKRSSCLRAIASLMNRYQPDLVAVESPIMGKSRRCERVRELIGSIVKLAIERRVRTRAISRAQVREVFIQEGARTKHEIATAITVRLPELAPRLPRFRQPWMPEDGRMAIFDALAIALTFYELNAKRQKERLSTLGINHDVETEEAHSRN